MKKTLLAMCLSITMVFCGLVQPATAAPSAYMTSDFGDYVIIDMNNKHIKPIVMIAGDDNMGSAQSVASMAEEHGAFAAINGTYFSAYDGFPVPYGTIIQDGKLLHILNSGAVAGITADAELLIDRLQFEFKGYINGEYRSIPWRINHPSPEYEAIALFTPEYGMTIPVEGGAKAVVVQDERVIQIATQDFNVPANGFAILYQPGVAYLVDERFDVGDKVTYESIIKTTYTNASDWDDVVCAIGAGPSLIINGQVTANGEIEGFTEAKINTNAAGRSFIGATAEGKIIIGRMNSATLTQAAEHCQKLGLVNAMCLDGGGSVALYYNGSKGGGRDVNNALGFVDTTPVDEPAPEPQPEVLSPTPIMGNYVALPSSDTVVCDGKEIAFDAYNIEGSNYYKLRDLAYMLNGSSKSFSVNFDAEKNAISLISGQPYEVAGGELTLGGGVTKTATVTTAKVYWNQAEVALTAYNINGNNYFKLRDIMGLADVAVGYNDENRVITLLTQWE